MRVQTLCHWSLGCGGAWSGRRTTRRARGENQHALRRADSIIPASGDYWRPSRLEPATAGSTFSVEMLSQREMSDNQRMAKAA